MRLVGGDMDRVMRKTFPRHEKRVGDGGSSDGFGLEVFRTLEVFKLLGQKPAQGCGFGFQR